MNPSDQPTPIKITAETPPQFPCWLWNSILKCWHGPFEPGTFDICAMAGAYTHWLPDSPEAPTVVPDVMEGFAKHVAANPDAERSIAMAQVEQMSQSTPAKPAAVPPQIRSEINRVIHTLAANAAPFTSPDALVTDICTALAPFFPAPAVGELREAAQLVLNQVDACSEFQKTFLPTHRERLRSVLVTSPASPSVAATALQDDGKWASDLVDKLAEQPSGPGFKSAARSVLAEFFRSAPPAVKGAARDIDEAAFTLEHYRDAYQSLIDVNSTVVEELKSALAQLAQSQADLASCLVEKGKLAGLLGKLCDEAESYIGIGFDHHNESSALAAVIKSARATLSSPATSAQENPS